MPRRLILYGAGRRCQQLCKILRHSDFMIESIIDSDSTKWGTDIEGYYIESPEVLRNSGKYENTGLCITVANDAVKEKIRDQLWRTYQYQVKTELSYVELVLMAYIEMPKIKQKIVHHGLGVDEEKTVLLDCYNGLGLGGVESWTMDICKAMIQKGWENVNIISKMGNYNVPPVLSDHILYVDINGQERFHLKSVLDLIELMLKKMPCRVVTCTVDAVMMAACVIKNYYPNRIKVISVIHNSSKNVYSDQMAFRRYVDAYVAVSQDIKYEMIHQGAVAEKVYSITCPFPCEEILDRTYTDNSLPLRIGYAGRMDGMEHSQKRMDLLLKLIEQLKESGITFYMELAGDGIARHDMEEFVKNYDLEDKVLFLGQLPRSKMAQFWQRQDVCINLADYEGRSISIIEAMGNGAVPVVTDTSGVREDIEDGVNGYIVSLGGVELMAERIVYLAEHRKQLSGMGQRAHDAVYPKSLMEPHLRFWDEMIQYGR